MTEAGRIGIWSDDPDGGDLFWLDALGIVTGLRYSSVYPGGSYNATWQMLLDPRFDHRAVQPGRQVGLSCGASTIWGGNLDNPVRGDVWQFTAIGAAAVAKRMLAYAPVSGNALNLNEVIANANTRGLGWTVVGSLPTIAGAVQSGTIYIDDALSQVSAGQVTPPYWSLDRDRNLTMGPPPTTPGYILLVNNTGGGRTLDAFATDAYVTYSSATGVLSTAVRSNTAARNRFGRFEVPVDETGLGLIATSQANAFGDGYLNRNAPRAKFRSAFTLTPGQLLTAAGTPIDPALAVPGVLASMLVIDPDSSGDVTLAGPTNVLLGVTDYDVDSGVLTVTPTDVADDTLTGLLSQTAT
jgi:hypothetical protein